MDNFIPARSKQGHKLARAKGSQSSRGEFEEQAEQRAWNARIDAVRKAKE